MLHLDVNLYVKCFNINKMSNNESKFLFLLKVLANKLKYYVIHNINL